MPASMSRFAILVIFWLLFIYAEGIPVETRGFKAKFTASQSIQKPFRKSGPAALAMLYGKYNERAPEEVTAALANGGGGTVTASPESYDMEYLCPVTIGGQTLNMDFDTGSSDL